MKKSYLKALGGSLVVLLVGSSCCWLTALLGWLGVGSILGVAGVSIENSYLRWVVLASVLVLILVYLYRRKK